MTWKLLHRHAWFELVVALGCAAAACSDEADGPPAAMTSTGSNQPSGSGGTMNVSSGGAVGVVSGASGMNGAGEAPATGVALDNMGGMTSSTSSAGSASMDPACSADTDGDGTNDCVDGCPQDPSKLEAGTCGCGVLDSDIDFDGALDCQEECPGDALKLVPGACGCGLPDVDTDTDGTLDCDDDCPFDDTHVTPGVCGCGAPDTLQQCLRHRYSFDGTGLVATDSTGGADGDIRGGATLTDTGTLVLAGTITDQYVNLPAGIISRLGPNATFEVWVAWTGAGLPWQRIFDFGSSDQPAGQQGPNGVTYLFLTPTNSINSDLRVAYTNAGPPLERVVNAPTPLPFPAQVHVAVVIDGTAATMSMYQNGVLIGTAPTLDTSLALLNDVNNWLGRSQFAPDEEFQGTLDEVRIYSAARSAAQIALDAAAGPDALPAQ